MASPTDQVVALPPPPGQVSNLIDPKSLATWNLVCVLVCLITTTTVLFLRSYVRLWMKREWILEDCESSPCDDGAITLIDLDMCCLSWVSLAYESPHPTFAAKNMDSRRFWLLSAL